MVGILRLAPNPRTEADLRWRFCVSDGEIGLKSLFPGMILKIQLHGGAPPSATQREPDERQVEACRKVRNIDRALEEMKAPLRKRLWACYGPAAPVELHAYGSAAGCAVEAAERGYWSAVPADRRPDRMEWLAKLALKARKDKAAATLRAKIQADADALLREAVSAFELARRQGR